MSETVTEGDYNRAHLTAYLDFTAGALLLAAAASVNDIQLMIQLALFGSVFFSWCLSTAVDGYNRKIWGRWYSNDWTLDDIDTDDFADGAVEVDT